MKIAIISDTHDNLPNLEKAIEWMNKNNIEQIIHCGDLCAPATLKEVLAPKFKGQIHMVYGNVEDRENLPEVVAEFEHVTHYGDVGELELDRFNIAFVHYPWEAKELAESEKYDFVFYGHTHKPWSCFVPTAVGTTQDKSCFVPTAVGTTQDKEEKKVELINPGTLAGLFYKATFVVWDTRNGEMELKILERI